MNHRPIYRFPSKSIDKREKNLKKKKKDEKRRRETIKKRKKNNRYRSIKGSSITRENNLRIFATGIRYRVNHAILPLKDISSFHFFFFFFFSFFHLHTRKHDDSNKKETTRRWPRKITIYLSCSLTMFLSQQHPVNAEFLEVLFFSVQVFSPDIADDRLRTVFSGKKKKKGEAAECSNRRRTINNFTILTI